MVFLSNELTTPQIFFNSLHVGGLAEIKKLFNIYIQEAEAELEEGAFNKDALERQNQRKEQQHKKHSFSESTQTPPSSPSMTPSSTPLTTASSTASSCNGIPSSSQETILLERITSSVLQQSSPTHEPKLRIPSRHKINHYQQSIQFEYDSWVERMKAHDIFHLSHAHGKEKLSIQDITRTLLDTSSLSATKKSIRYSGFGFIPTSVHFHTRCFRGKDIIPIFQQEYQFLVQMDNDGTDDGADIHAQADTSIAVTSVASAAVGSFAGSVETPVISNTKNKKKDKTKNTTTNTTLQDTMAFGQTLLDLGILHHVQDDKTTKNKSKNESKSNFTTNGIYRLQPYQSTHILNKFRLWNKICIVDGNDPQPLLTLSSLTKMINQAILTGTTRTTTSSSPSLDFCTIRKSEIFQSFEENVCLLQLTNLDDMHERSRLVFFINLHNLMMKHAIILQHHHHQQQHDTKKSSSLSEFFSKISYIIGDHTFTLDEIYHGMLRCNAKHPKTGKQMFSESDPRCKFKCTTTNPRVHFALLYNYWNESSNVNRNNTGCNFLNIVDTYEFHQEAVIGELFIVAQRSCKSDDRITMDENKNILYLPKFVRFYLDDFISGWNGIDNDLPRAISKYLIGEKREILTEMLKKATIDAVAGGSSIDLLSKKKKKKKIKNEFIKVIFRDHTTPLAGMTSCLPLYCVNGSGCGSSMIKSNLSTKLTSGGCFPQVNAFPEDELKLLSDENDFVEIEPDLPEPIDVDCVSQSSSSLRGWYMSNNWDMMSSESSWNLDNDKLWQKTFHSKSFSTSTTGKSRSGLSDHKRKVYTPSKPPRRLNEKRKSSSPKTVQQSPSTTLTASTTHSSHSLTNPPTPARISKVLVLPEFKDEGKSDVSSSNSYYHTNTDDGFSYDDNSCCSAGPRQLFTKEQHQNKNEQEEGEIEKKTSTVSTKEIINIFFPPIEMTGGNEDEKSYDGSNLDDGISYNSQSLNHGSFASFLSRDSSFEKLFNSSMASI